MKRILLFVALVLASGGTSWAQDAHTAQLFNQSGLSGTARVQALGGAFGALGADLSSALFNPAGLAFYRRSELSLSGEMTFRNTEGSLDPMGQMRPAASYKSKGFSQVGYVGSIVGDDQSLASFNFAVGYNRVALFDHRYRLQADNYSNSLTDYYAYLADGNSHQSLTDYESSSMLAELAWNAYLIDTVPGSRPNQYFSVHDAFGVRQQKSATLKGSSGEYFLSMAANYNHQWYFGATVGIRNFELEEDFTLTETDATGTMSDFDRFDYNARSRTNGTGMNMRLGLIYKPVQWLRAGISIETPTFFALKHRFYHDMQTWFKNGDITEPVEISTEYDYEMVSPFRSTLSAAVFLGGQAFVSADVEYVDYRGISFYAPDYDYDVVENPEIRAELRNTANLRLGGEYRVAMVALRAGLAYYGNPYAGSVGFNAQKLYLTSGLGFRSKSFFADLSLVYGTSDNKTFLQDKYDATRAYYTLSDTRAMLSMGIFF